MSRLSDAVVALLLATGAAYGQEPFVDNLFVADPPLTIRPPSFNFIDIPGSAKTLTLPSGTAFLSWSLNLDTPSSDIVVRPAIGNSVPPNFVISSVFKIRYVLVSM